jgi:chromosome segregation ATPase
VVNGSQLEIEAKPEAVNFTQDLNASVLGSPQSTRLLPGGSPATKKRRRSTENNEIENEDPRDNRIRDLASQLKDAKSHLAMATEAMTEINAKHELVLEKAAAERHELVAQVKALVAQRQHLAASTEELAAKLNAAEAEHEQQRKSFQQQMTERDSELDALKTECDEAKRALEETETLLNERNKQLAALKAESPDLMKRLVSSEKQSENAQSATVDNGDRQKAVERQRQLEETIAALRQELDASRRRNSALEDNVSASRCFAEARSTSHRSWNCRDSRQTKQALMCPPPTRAATHLRTFGFCAVKGMRDKTVD